MRNDALSLPSSHRIDDAAIVGALRRADAQRIAQSFDRVAREDFQALAQFDERARWEDYCPAYAVGLVTYDACTRHAGGITEDTLHDAWRSLRGTSRLGWEQAQEIIARSWSALAGIERDGSGQVRVTDAIPLPGEPAQARPAGRRMT